LQTRTAWRKDVSRESSGILIFSSETRDPRNQELDKASTEAGAQKSSADGTDGNVITLVTTAQQVVAALKAGRPDDERLDVVTKAVCELVMRK
jgi:hypothetical protein